MLAPFTIMRWFLTYFPISAAAFQCNCNTTVFTIDGEGTVWMFATKFCSLQQCVRVEILANFFGNQIKVDKDNSELCHDPISKFDEELWHKCETGIAHL